MGTQNQAKKWHDIFVILLLLDFAYVLMFITFCYAPGDFWNNIVNNLTVWRIILVLVLFVLPVIVVVCLHYRAKNNALKQKELEIVLKYGPKEKIDEIFNNLNNKVVNNTITAQIESAMKNSDDLEKVLTKGVSNALLDSKVISDIVVAVSRSFTSDQMANAVNEVLKNSESRIVLKRAILGNISKVIREILKEDYANVVESIMANNSVRNAIHTVLKDKITIPIIQDDMLNTAMTEAFRDKVSTFKEIETKKYHFVERVVESICKTNIINDAQINAIRDIVDGIVKVSHAEVLQSDDDIIRLVLKDIYNNRFEIRYKKSNKMIDSVSPDGKYRMTDQINIVIKDNIIEDISSSKEK